MLKELSGILWNQMGVKESSPRRDWASYREGFVLLMILLKKMINVWERSVLCRVVVVLLLVRVSQSSSKSMCNYSEIVNTYKEIIFVDLKNLNLTTSFNPTKERDRCPSEQQLKVVHSIYGMTQTFLSLGRAVSSQDGMGKPVEMMAQLISQSCTHIKAEVKKPKTGNRRRIHLIRALIHCWEKLLNMYTPEG